MAWRGELRCITAYLGKRAPACEPRWKRTVCRNPRL